MTVQTWHSEFNPQKFLSRVSLDALIERNVAYNENSVSDSRAPCIFCKETSPRGILLNDKSFLCQLCYLEISMISYPEKYESKRRQYLISSEARKLAWQSFRERFEYRSEESSLVFLGWVSTILALVNPIFLALTGFLLFFGYEKNIKNKKKIDEWLALKLRWEQSNPEYLKPELKHFHDPMAELTERDRLVLKVFNHWPGYPPFWKYLRSVVIAKDSNRCQVTGCPSRLELHVHHMHPVSGGGTHTPDNLVSLCDFHHALEPEKGHERIWGNIKTRYFTLVSGHERSNRASNGAHLVKAHLRRLQLVTIEDLNKLKSTYGFCCPSCNAEGIRIELFTKRNVIRAECGACSNFVEGAQQLTEESGPMLAEILGVSRNGGRWRARWDMLSERKSAVWGTWRSQKISEKRKQHKVKVETEKSTPLCPQCSSPMRIKRPWKPNQTWKPFWGCTQYDVSGCRGSAKYSGK